jgi:hypothetical protein
MYPNQKCCLCFVKERSPKRTLLIPQFVALCVFITGPRSSKPYSSVAKKIRKINPHKAGKESYLRHLWVQLAFICIPSDTTDNSRVRVLPAGGRKGRALPLAVYPYPGDSSGCPISSRNRRSAGTCYNSVQQIVFGPAAGQATPMPVHAGEQNRAFP